MTELFKLVALMVFGSAIASRLFSLLPLSNYGRFGPKGFASVVHGLIIWHAGLRRLGHLVGIAVIASIVVYSSTDILVGRWLQAHAQRPESASDA